MAGMIQSRCGFSTRFLRFLTNRTTSMIGIMMSGISFSGGTSSLPKDRMRPPPRPLSAPYRRQSALDSGATVCSMAPKIEW